MGTDVGATGRDAGYSEPYVDAFSQGALKRSLGILKETTVMLTPAAPFVYLKSQYQSLSAHLEAYGEGTSEAVSRVQSQYDIPQIPIANAIQSCSQAAEAYYVTGNNEAAGGYSVNCLNDTVFSALIGFGVARGLTANVAERNAQPQVRPVRELEVGRFDDLTDRAIVGDRLANDHIPSVGALKASEEAQLGRPLTPSEVRALRDCTYCIVVRDPIHAQSRTFKGRNTLAVRQFDAQDLFAAARRDADVFYRNSVQQGLNPMKVRIAIVKLHFMNWWSGRY